MISNSVIKLYWPELYIRSLWTVTDGEDFVSGLRISARRCERSTIHRYSIKCKLCDEIIASIFVIQNNDIIAYLKSS